MRHPRKNISIHLFTICLIFLAALALVYSIYNVQRVNTCVQHQAQIWKNRTLCDQQISAFMAASDLLTTEARYYITTQHNSHLENYWNEVSATRTRDKAVARLFALDTSPQEQVLAEAAINASDALVQLEAKGMRLAAEAAGLPQAQMPPTVAAIQLTEQEIALSTAAQVQLATDIIFGEAYTLGKQVIINRVEALRTALVQRTSEQSQAAIQSTTGALHIAQFTNVFLFLLLSCAIALFYALVIRPLNKYSRALTHLGAGDVAPLAPCGSKELRLFATAFNDVYSAQQKQNQLLHEINAKDGLTGIANRTTLDHYMRGILHSASGNLGLLMLDLDGFKTFNDSFGHLAGDKILVAFAQCLQGHVPPETGMAGRLGGEEFAVALPGTTEARIRALAQDILACTRNLDTCALAGSQKAAPLTVSIGSTLWPGYPPVSAKNLLHQADLALYQAKREGKARHVAYCAKERTFIALQHAQDARREVEAEMRDALKNGEFVPHYQPKFDLRTRRVAGLEALARWQHPQRGLLLPGSFIPIFEANHFIVDLDLFMFQTICRTLRGWLDDNRPLTPIACNFSRLHFSRPAFAQELIDTAADYGVSPAYLEIEITESYLAENRARIAPQLAQLREAGFSVAIDDFGAGYSSLGVLQTLPIDAIKIDRSFLQGPIDDRRGQTLLSGILHLAQGMGIRAICEGIETAQQDTLLRRLGGTYVQGFYYARPLPQREAEDLLQKESD